MRLNHLQSQSGQFQGNLKMVCFEVGFDREKEQEQESYFSSVVMEEVATD